MNETKIGTQISTTAPSGQVDINNYTELNYPEKIIPPADSQKKAIFEDVKIVKILEGGSTKEVSILIEADRIAERGRIREINNLIEKKLKSF